jgi:hypothetical protein
MSEGRFVCGMRHAVRPQPPYQGKAHHRHRHQESRISKDLRSGGRQRRTDRNRTRRFINFQNKVARSLSRCVERTDVRCERFIGLHSGILGRQLPITRRQRVSIASFKFFVQLPHTHAGTKGGGSVAMVGLLRKL